jgi:hypothetical protein
MKDSPFIAPNEQITRKREEFSTPPKRESTNAPEIDRGSVQIKL